MKSGGQTKAIDIKVGRKLLCKEKPNTKPTSKCAKTLAKTVKTAKRGLTAKQQKLWRKYVYTSALVQARLFCKNLKIFSHAGAEGAAPRPTEAQKYSKCVIEVLSGKKKVKGPFKAEFKWADFLIKGAKMIKKIPAPRPIIKPPEGDGPNPNS